MIVVLDTGVLGLLASPIREISEAENSEITRCTEWFYSLLAKSVYFVTSDISDYEVRRELIRIQSQGLDTLDYLRNTKNMIDFLPLTTEVMMKAAELWANARQNHISTADDKNIDADMIITAQWMILKESFPGRGVFIATKNLRHMKIFAKDNALEWIDIKA